MVELARSRFMVEHACDPPVDALTPVECTEGLYKYLLLFDIY